MSLCKNADDNHLILEWYFVSKIALNYCENFWVINLEELIICVSEQFLKKTLFELFTRAGSSNNFEHIGTIKMPIGTNNQHVEPSLTTFCFLNIDEKKTKVNCAENHHSYVENTMKTYALSF